MVPGLVPGAFRQTRTKERIMSNEHDIATKKLLDEMLRWAADLEEVGGEIRADRAAWKLRDLARRHGLSQNRISSGAVIAG